MSSLVEYQYYQVDLKIKPWSFIDDAFELNNIKSSILVIYSIITFVINIHHHIEDIVSKKSTLLVLRIWDSYMHTIAYSYLNIYISKQKSILNSELIKKKCRQ